MIKVLLYILALTSISILTSGCISTDVPEEVIYGKWAGDLRLNETIEFLHDGTVKINYAGDTIDGTYELKDGHLTVDVFVAHKITMDGTISDLGLSYELVLIERTDSVYKDKTIYLRPKYR